MGDFKEAGKVAEKRGLAQNRRCRNNDTAHFSECASRIERGENAGDIATT
jgi:hypothetical protein